MHWVYWLVLGPPLALLTGIGIYALGSYFLSYSHVDKRARFAFFKEVAREVFWASLIQPLLPAGYFFWRRLHGEGKHPVVFVHGYSQNRANFLYLARALKRHRVGPIYGFNYAWLSSLPSIAASLARFVDAVRLETKADKVDLVCHSMGGLVAAEYLAHAGGATHVRRWVTIATPHRGIAYRGPIFGRAHAALRAGHGLAQMPDVPLLTIYSSHDNVVFPPLNARWDVPAQSVVVPGVGHLAILFSRTTADAIAKFLEEEAAPVAAAAAPVTEVTATEDGAVVPPMQAAGTSHVGD